VTSIATPNVTSFGYTYDANKNKLTETLGAPMANYGFTVPQNGYDNENRLVGWNRTDGQKNQAWTLTAAGDWQGFTETNSPDQNRMHNAAHELTGINGTTLTYDLKGNLTTNSNGQTYVWDFDNRLASATVGANTHGYSYDALGRRISKSVMADGGTGQQSATVTVFVSDGRQEVAEYLGGADPSNPSHNYTFGQYIDEPVTVVTITGTTEAKYYYHHNNLYSVAALTDQAGVVQERYSYTAYGKGLFCDATGVPLSREQSPVGNQLLFTGRRLDPETGLYYYRARYYDADQGRFVGRDPIVADINLYRYSGSGPLSFVDSSGEATTSPAPIDCSTELASLIDKYYQENKPTDEEKCLEVPMASFFTWVMKQYEGKPDMNLLWLNRCMGQYGCIGICHVHCQDCVKPPTENAMTPRFPAPEKSESTHCFLDEKLANAAAKKCKNDEHGLVWAKQGRWLNGKQPIPNSDTDEIPPDQIESKDPENPGKFNYVTNIGDYYIGGDSGAGSAEGGVNHLKICTKKAGPPFWPKTATMWCATCVKCNKKQGGGK
jgi:RHS repeat-associated protein